MSEKDKQGLPNRNNIQNDEELFLEDTSVVASTMECTGLTPSAVLSEEEAESYSEIYPVPLPKNKVNNGLQKEKGIGGDMSKNS